MKHLLSIVVVGCLGTVSAVASADNHAPDDEKIQLTLPAKRWMVNALLEVNLSKDSAFEPVSIAPDVWYGVNDKLTLGVTHSGYGTAGFFGGVGNGICFTGESNGCAEVYQNLGLTGRYSLLRGDLAVALQGGAYIRTFDPFLLSMQAGALARWTSDRFSLLAQPMFTFGVTERDLGNKEILSIPVGVNIAATEKVSLGLQTGVVLPLQNTGDVWTIPASAVASYLLSQRYYLFGAFSLPTLLGGDAINDGVDARTLSLGFGYAL